MKRNPWAYLAALAIASGVYFFSTAYADDTTTAESATDARHAPVVAPVPSGIDPADPSRSSASPSDDVHVSSPTINSTDTTSGSSL